MTKENLKLEIAESLQEDIDKGIARVPSGIMDKMGLASGDLVELSAKNKVVVRALRAHKRELSRESISAELFS